MIETSIEEINVDELMKKIKAEVRKKKSRPEMLEQNHPDPFPRMALAGGINPGLSDSSFQCHSEPFQEKLDGYGMDDFLKYHHRDFVINAYRGILKRSPDSDGFDHFLRDLQSGKITKAEILGRLRFSPEGRSKKVKVKGLAVQFGIQLLFRIPLLGYFFRLIVGVLNLPMFFCNFQKLEASTAVQLNDQRNQSTDILNRMQDLTHMQQQFREDLIEKADVEDLNELAELKADRAEITELMRDLKLMVIDQERRLKLILEEARKRLPDPIEVDQIEEMLGEEDHIDGAMYVSFEDKMRGTREDIKHRQKAYLPFIKAAGAGTETYPVIDLGCGRGEWLELLKENGFFVKGVEINKVMTGCKSRPLED